MGIIFWRKLQWKWKPHESKKIGYVKQFFEGQVFELGQNVLGCKNNNSKETSYEVSFCSILKVFSYLVWILETEHISADFVPHFSWVCTYQRCKVFIQRKYGRNLPILNNYYCKHANVIFINPSLIIRHYKDQMHLKYFYFVPLYTHWE